MLQTDDCSFDPPNGEFRDSGSHAHKLRWILGRIRQAGRTRKTGQLLDGGLDDARFQVNPIDHVLAHLGSVWVLASLDGPTFSPGFIKLRHYRRCQLGSCQGFRGRGNAESRRLLDLGSHGGAYHAQSVDVGNRAGIPWWRWRRRGGGYWRLRLLSHRDRWRWAG